MTEELASSLNESSDVRILYVISDDFYSGKRLAVHMDAMQDLLSIDGLERLYVEVYSGIKKVGVAEMFYSGMVPGSKSSGQGDGESGQADGEPGQTDGEPGQADGEPEQNGGESGDIFVYDSGVYIEDYYIHDNIDLNVKVRVKVKGRSYTVGTKTIKMAATKLSDIYECFASLKSGRYMAFIAAKDDAGRNLDDKTQRLLQELGLTINLKDAVRRGFYIVIDGRVKKEALVQKVTDTASISDSISNDLTGLSIDYKIVSSGYEAENRAEIVINDRQYALNFRGLNIVLYDKKSDKVIDSAVFDTFSNSEKYLMNQEDFN